MLARLAFLVLLLLAIARPGLAAAPVAGALSVRAEGGVARVRLALSAPVEGSLSVLALDGPRRLAIDIGGASSHRRTAAGAGPVSAARVGQFDPETVRIVLDLARPATLRAARLAPGPALELDLVPVDEARFAALLKGGRTRLLLSGDAPALASVEAALAAASGPQGAARPAPPAGATAAPPDPARRARQRPVVVLDPGHGGRDVGTIGVTGHHEKDVTLAIARATARLLERGGKVEVRLTRTDDRFLTLAERVNLARGWNAALFISIHADSAPNALARGASVYTLSETASDREAARLAAKENRADAIAGRDLSAEEGDAQVVLIDLALRDSMNASADFAQMLQRRLEPEGVLFRSQFHRFAGFQVLKNLGVPAVLLEAGYLSNAEDAAVLVSAEGQRRIASGIARAAEAWLARP